jgi:hypothetical protein
MQRLKNIDILIVGNYVENLIYFKFIVKVCDISSMVS